jgi:hypothetical protein
MEDGGVVTNCRNVQTACISEPILLPRAGQQPA